MRAPAKRPHPKTGLTRPKHPKGMRSEVFLVLFLQKKNSSIRFTKEQIKIVEDTKLVKFSGHLLVCQRIRQQVSKI
jgi:hypothetical protein